MTVDDHQVLEFKAITSFVSDLNSVFSKRFHTLALYNRLLEKTCLSHDEYIKRHIEIFRLFCTSNRDAIYEHDKAKFTMNEVKYSNRVYINIRQILDVSDQEEENAIWKHILTISALLDPSGKARNVLKDMKDNNEALFLQKAMAKIEDKLGPSALESGQNPMSALAGIMSSGVFTDLFSMMNEGMASGNLDVGKLLGSVQGMMQGMGTDPNQMAAVNSMIQSMVPPSINEINE